MGLSYSTETPISSNADIIELKNELVNKNDIIEDLQNQINSLRTAKFNNTLQSEDLIEINKVWLSRDYENLVFSGGGIKGLGYCGSLPELQKFGVIYDSNNMFKIKGICGVSAGSIIASLLAIGYTPTELVSIMQTVDFAYIATDNDGYIIDAVDFVEKWGMCPGKYILQLMGELIQKKTGNADYTINQLYNDKNIKLVIVSTDITYQRSVYMYPGNPDIHYSDIPIRIAIRMSMSIPFLFEPYQYNGSYFIDGGTLDNYPLHVFDGPYPGEQNARLNLCKPNPKTLGLNIMTDNETINYALIPKQVYTSLCEYSIGLMDTFLSENERRIMTPSYWIRSIILITPNYPITTFTLTSSQKDELITVGQNAVDIFFTKNATVV